MGSTARQRILKIDNESMIHKEKNSYPIKTSSSSKLETSDLRKSIKRMKGQNTDTEKIFVNNASNKGLIPRTYVFLNLSKLNGKIAIQQDTGKRHEQTFQQKDTEMAKNI